MSIVTTQQAIEELLRGDIVALPTETVYGLSARIDNEAALKKVFATKHRPSFDPLIVHVENRKQAHSLCVEWPEIYDALAEKFWPGPLSLIAKKRSAVSHTISAGLDTVALRSPNHPLFREVLRGVGVPLAAPSANRFGRTSPTRASHVETEFAGKVAVVDGGECNIGVESTVLSATLANDKWQIKILRPGGCTREALEKFLTESGFKFEIARETSALSPGHLKEHYQPESPLILLEEKNWNEEIQKQCEKKLSRRFSGVSELKLPQTPQEAARVLYAEMRRLSQSEAHALWTKRTRDQQGDAWEAIWDRLERASSLII